MRKNKGKPFRKARNRFKGKENAYCSPTIVYKKDGTIEKLRHKTNGEIINPNGISPGEITINKYLRANDIRFESEYIFTGCSNPETGYPLRFDFYISKFNCCIEYNGSQHYRINTRYHSKDKEIAEKQLLSQKYRDSIKKKFCKDNNIKLLIIVSKDFNKIPKILKEMIDKNRKILSLEDDVYKE